MNFCLDKTPNSQNDLTDLCHDLRIVKSLALIFQVRRL